MEKDLVLVTGCSGMVASRCIEILSGKFDFIGVSRKASPDFPGCELLNSYINCDVTDPDALAKIISQTPAQTIVHMAALLDMEGSERSRDQGPNSLSWQVNVRATETVAHLAQQYDKRVILASTYLIFDGNNGPYDEDSATPNVPDNISWYGWTKLQSEETLRQNLDNWAILRLPTLYRSYFPTKGDLARLIASNVKSREAISLSDNQLFTPLLGDRVAEGIGIIIDKNAQGVFHISPAGYLSPYEFACNIGYQLTGNLTTDSIKPVPYIPENNFVPRPIDGRLSMVRLTELGYKPHTIDSDIRIFLKQLGNLQ